MFEMLKSFINNTKASLDFDRLFLLMLYKSLLIFCVFKHNYLINMLWNFLIDLIVLDKLKGWYGLTFVMSNKSSKMNIPLKNCDLAFKNDCGKIDHERQTWNSTIKINWNSLIGILKMIMNNLKNTTVDRLARDLKSTLIFDFQYKYYSEDSFFIPWQSRL